jgi:hypothetical protein
MKFFAASIPRNVRTAKLGHLPVNSFIGTWHIPNPRGGFQVFDVLMLPEADFMRAKNHLATITPMGTSPHANQMNLVFAIKDAKECEASAAVEAAAYFRPLFKIAEA